jgi:anaerobic magnesium-protoporphyrin IX monomethyl ester cyclase
VKYETIPGLGYKTGSGPGFNQPFCGFEPVHFKKIPYHLIPDYSVYGQIGSRNRVFPIYSAHGCPYNCSFCISPVTYKNFPQKWMPLPSEEVVDHIDYLVKELKADEIYFYDDDSFVNPEHISSILTELRRRNLKVRLSFRGARINELLKMDDEFLQQLAEAGTNILHIGVESGTPRILELFDKGVTLEDILEVNRKLSRHDTLIAAYNWIIGNPTETEREIVRTARFLLRLIRENPRCIIFPPNMLRPIPGTKIARLASEMGYRAPALLADWIREENESDLERPWHDKELVSYSECCM